MALLTALAALAFLFTSRMRAQISSSEPRSHIECTTATPHSLSFVLIWRCSIEDDLKLSTTSTAIHNVIPCIRVLYSQWSGHDVNISESPTTVNRRTPLFAIQSEYNAPNKRYRRKRVSIPDRPSHSKGYIFVRRPCPHQRKWHCKDRPLYTIRNRCIVHNP